MTLRAAPNQFSPTPSASPATPTCCCSSSCCCVGTMVGIGFGLPLAAGIGLRPRGQDIGVRPTPPGSPRPAQRVPRTSAGSRALTVVTAALVLPVSAMVVCIVLAFFNGLGQSGLGEQIALGAGVVALAGLLAAVVSQRTLTRTGTVTILVLGVLLPLSLFAEYIAGLAIFFDGDPVVPYAPIAIVIGTVLLVVAILPPLISRLRTRDNAWPPAQPF